MRTGEEQPLLRPLPEDIETGSKHCDKSIDFDPNGDSEDPRQWPRAFKWAMVLLLAFMAFTVYVAI